MAFQISEVVHGRSWRSVELGETVSAPALRISTGWIVVGVVLALAVIGSLMAPSTPSSSTAAGAVAERDQIIESKLASVIRSAGSSCAATRRTFKAGVADDLTEFWNAECTGGESYVVKVAPDGSSKVLSCDVYTAATGRKCFVPLR